MNRIFVGIILVTLLVGFVSADLVATIGMQGLSFVNPEIAAAVKIAMCVIDPILGIVTCATQFVSGKIVGQVQGELLQKVADVGPEGAKAVQILSTYNQVQGYIDAGATIVKELQVNERGEIDTGVFNTPDGGSDISKMISNDLEEGSIIVEGRVEFFLEKGEKFTKIDLDTEGNTLRINTKDPKTGENIELTYKNLDPDGGFIENNIVINQQGEIISANLYVNENGGEYVIGNYIISAPPNSGIIYDKKRGVLDLEVFGGRLERFPEKFDDELENIPLQIGGNVELPSKDYLDYGKLIYHEGFLYIEGQDSSSISGVRINNYGTNSGKINLFFNDLLPLDSEENYILFDSEEKSLSINSGKSQIQSISFGKESRYLKKELGETISFNNLKNIQVNLKSGDENSPILIKITEKENSEYDIHNGKIRVFSENGNIKTEIYSAKDQVPLSSIFSEIIIEDDQERNLLGTQKEPKKIFIDSFNGLTFIPKGDIETQRRLKINYENLELIKKEIEQKYNIKITGDADLYAYRRINDILSVATPSLIESMDELEIKRFDSPFKGGDANPRGGKIRISRSALYEVALLHEAAHTRTFKLYQEPLENFNKEFLILKEQYQNKEISNQDLRDGIQRIRRKYMETGEKFEYGPKTQFIKNWETAAGDAYGKDLSFPPKKKFLKIFTRRRSLSSRWIPEDGTSQEEIFRSISGKASRNGCVRAYGCNNIFEDIATFVEAVYKNPFEISKVINPNYKGYDERYLIKLNLLKEYDYITDESYDQIIEASKLIK